MPGEKEEEDDEILTKLKSDVSVPIVVDLTNKIQGRENGHFFYFGPGPLCLAPGHPKRDKTAEKFLGGNSNQSQAQIATFSNINLVKCYNVESIQVFGWQLRIIFLIFRME